MSSSQFVDRVYSTGGENLKANGGRGSSFIWSICKMLSSICCDCWPSAFFEGHLGADIVLGALGFFLISLATFGVALYSAVENYTNMVMLIYAGAGLCFAVGAFGVLFTSYKTNENSAVVWGIVLWALCCGSELEGTAEERQPITAGTTGDNVVFKISSV